MQQDMKLTAEPAHSENEIPTFQYQQNREPTRRIVVDATA